MPAMAYTFAAVSGSDASSLMVVYPATPSVATTATEAVTSAAGKSGIGGGGGAEPEPAADQESEAARQARLDKMG